MVIQISDEQRSALQRGEAVRVTADDVGDVVVIRAVKVAADGAADDARAWAQTARQARDSWGEVNPFYA